MFRNFPTAVYAQDDIVSAALPPSGGSSNLGSPSPPSGAPSGGRELPDLPPDPSQDSGDREPGMRFIDEAFNALSDPEHGEPQQELPFPGAAPPFKPKDQYPQPVVPQQPVAQPPPPVVQPTQPAAPQPQAPLTAEQQAEEHQRQRVRNDPFGVQAEILEQQEALYTKALAEQVYPISQQDMDAFLSGDAKVVSGALAKVHINAVTSVMKVVSQQLPMMMGHYMQLQQLARSREEQFYKNNPFLNPKDHNHMVPQIARTYRQMYPQATDEQIDKAVGIMVAAAAGISVPGMGAPPAQHRTAEGVRTPGKVVRRTTGAFAPSGANGAGGAPRVPGLSQWGETAEIVMADERGAFDR